MQLCYTILSHFDNLLGPKTFLKIPKATNKYPALDSVPLLMDLYKEGFFIHHFNGLKTANLIFEVKSPRARGRKENVMITLASPEEYNLKLTTFKEIIGFFAYQLTNIQDVYKGFYHEKNTPGSHEKYEEIINLMLSFHDCLPKQTELMSQKMSKVVSYGLSSTGVNSILENLQANITLPAQESNLTPFSKDVVLF